MKKFIAIAAVLAAISAVSLNAAAANVPDYVYANSIAPLYETASDAISTLTISGKTAKCESKLIGHSDVKSCKVVQTLEKKWGLWIWNEVDGASWNGTISSSSGKVSNSISGLSSGTYRLKSV
jgi:hypothetical protein